MPQYNQKDGRIWMQLKKFVPFELLLPYGMTDITDPSGALNAVREPSPSRRGESVVVDIIRGEPGLPSFNIETRLYKTLNFMLGLRKKLVNVQNHLGACDRPDNYYASEIALIWDMVRRGDANADRIGMIQGDDAPIAISSPFSGENILPVDFKVEFVSQRPIAEAQAITDIAMLLDECDDIATQHSPGDNGYLATKAGAGLYIQADVWYTNDAWENAYPTTTDSKPFGNSEDISSIVVLGTKNNHRVMVSRGTADGSNPAEIAYADVTMLGVTNWVLVNVGSINGQYINHLYWLDWTHLYAVTNDGYVYKSTNGGASWTAVLTTGVVAFYEVVALRGGIVWVGGASNTLYFSEDSGATWTAVSGPTDGSGDDILTVDVTPDGTVFIGNDAGEIYGTYDDGDTWTTLGIQGVTSTAVDRIRHYGNQIIWTIVSTADGSRALRSTDGGASFRLWSLNMPTNAGLNALFVVNQDFVMVGGEVQGSTAFLSKTKSNLIGFVVRLLD